jgi:hypothetical protein
MDAPGHSSGLVWPTVASHGVVSVRVGRIVGPATAALTIVGRLTLRRDGGRVVADVERMTFEKVVRDVLS